MGMIDTNETVSTLDPLVLAELIRLAATLLLPQVVEARGG